MVSIDPAAVMWSAPERERAERPLLVLLHGYGSYEGDLFGLSPHLPLSPVIASVRAPLAEGNGFSWFPLDGSDRLSIATASAQAVLDWIDTLSFSSVGLLGFSQGGAISLQALRLAPSRFSYVVNLSGFALPGSLDGDATLASSPTPVFWGRGTLDQVIQPAYIAHTADWLPSHSTLTERIYEDVPHAVSGPELSDVSAFIQEALAE